MDCRNWVPMRAAVVVVLSFAGLCSAQSRRQVDFLTEVQPIFTARCMPCHSGDNAQAGLKTHTREDLLKGGKSGAAIIPGNGSDSLLVQKISGQKGLRMPPSGPALTADAIAQIRIWIDQGAKWDGKPVATERLAAFAPRRPEVPSGAAANPVDRFLDAYFAKHNIDGTKTISDNAFARRAWYDITGLPPTPEQLNDFIKDEQKEQDKDAPKVELKDKRTRLVNRLLADRPAYAQHWISYWNDMLRNDEGVIYHGERKSITNWLRGALETNMPYNAMAWALLNPPPESDEEGFLTGVTWRGVVSASQLPPLQASQNAGQIFLGINLKCAACHDSFVNRWKLRDTYGLAAMFSNDKLELVRCDVPLGKFAEPRFPFEGVNVTFDGSLESRRRAAAEWITHPQNGRFARTIVNRYWKQLLGRGIVEPADDMDQRPWDEDVLDWLAADFTDHNYNLQHLIRRIMTSKAYAMPAVPESAAPKDYVFAGPRLRRLTAEQFEDTISAVTGDWRLNSARTETYATYTREWRLKSDSLSRALGRPIRDQVYTERATAATTLQALELTNGPELSKRLEHGSKLMLGLQKPSPRNLFDSKMVRQGAIPIDVDIAGAKDLYLMIEDVDSYDPERVKAGWGDAQLVGPAGAVPLDPKTVTLQTKTGTITAVPAKAPSLLHWNIAGKGYTRFRAKSVIDEENRKQSDISPALRFFVFTEKPDPDELIHVQGEPPYTPPNTKWTSPSLADRLYAHLLSRTPTPAEHDLAVQALGGKTPTQDGLEDLLWALLMSPEFQYVH
jgi:hypothetical protein